MKNRNYRYEVYQTFEDNHVEWIVKFPDIPGVIGCGDTEAEALTSAKENKDFYLDYLDETSTAYPQHASDLMQEVSGKVTLRMSKTTHRKLIERAQIEGVSLNSMVNEAVQTYLGMKSSNQNFSNILEQYYECFYNNKPNLFTNADYDYPKEIIGNSVSFSF